MEKHVRFIVHQLIDGKPRDVGLFRAAYNLRSSPDLSKDEYSRLITLLKWFESELGTPPRHELHPQAIFWYQNLGPFSIKMQELSVLLRECGLICEQVTASYVGRIVWRDEHQLAAIPVKRPRR